MKIALLLYETPDFDVISLSEDQKYSYEKLNIYGREEDVLFVRSSIYEYDQPSNTFKRYWEFEPKINQWLVKNTITPDIIVDKCVQTPESFDLKKIINTKIPMLNNPFFTELCDDKLLSYNYLKDYSPLTKVFDNSKDLLDDFKSEKVVLKPIHGSGGKGIKIIDKAEVFYNNSYSNYIVQEFIETKNGLDNFARRHDLRVVIINSEIVHCYIRSPRSEEMLISNVALGGEEIAVEIKDIPAGVLEVVSVINDKLSKAYGILFYTIDLLISDNKIYIVELNSKPGIYKSEGEDNLRKLDFVLKKLVNVCKFLTRKI